MWTRGTQSHRRNLDTVGISKCRGWRIGLIGAIALAAGLVTLPGQSQAQAALRDTSAAPSDRSPSAAVFATAGQRGRSARELDLRIQRALREQGGLRSVQGQGMDLAAVGLALDCVEESVKCLRAVAMKVGVDVLVAPSLERGKGDLVLTLLYFDARNTGALTRVVRWQAGEKLTPETLAAVPELVRGLVPTPAAAPQKPQPVSSHSALARAAAQTVAPTSSSRPSLVAPLIILASGVVMLGAGVATGVASQNNERELSAMLVRTRAEADAATRTRDTAKTQATVANVFYGLGAAATLVGGGWLALDLLGGASRERDPGKISTRAQLLPALSPKQVGLVYRQQGGGL